MHYGKVVRTRLNEYQLFFGDKKYAIDSASNEKLKPAIDGELVSFVFKTLPSGKSAVEIKDLIRPINLNKERMLKCIDSWQQDAKSDRGEFVPTDAYNQILSSRRCFVVGRKGVGKTALVKAVVKEIGIGEFFTSESLFKELEKYSGKNLDDVGYKTVFEILYLQLALIILYKSLEVNNPLRKTIQVQLDLVRGENPGVRIFDWIADRISEINSIDVFAQAAILGSGVDFNYSFVSDVIKVFASIFPRKNELTASSKLGFASQQDYQLSDLLIHKNALLEFYVKLGEKPKVMIAFDQLDEGYQIGKEEDYLFILENLLAATRSVATGFEGAIDSDVLNIHPVVILRDDIFNLARLKTNNGAKYLDSIVRPEWTERNIAQLIQSRLSEALGTGGGWHSFPVCWISFFHPYFSGEYSSQTSYLEFLKHTSYTPRDIIELLREIFSVISFSTEREDLRCSYDDFGRAAKKYSQYYVSQVADALKTAYPNIDNFFNKIRSECDSYIIHQDSFRQLVLDWLDLDLRRETEELLSLRKQLDGAVADESAREFLDSMFCEKKKKIESRKENEFSKFTAMLWGVCGIVYRDPKLKFRWIAVHSDPAAAQINTNHAVLIYPPVARYLNMSVSLGVQGGEVMPEVATGASSCDYDITEIQSVEGREAIERKLSVDAFLLKFEHEIPDFPSAYYFNHPSFSRKIYCPSKLIPRNYKKGDQCEAFITVREDSYKSVTDPNYFNFAVREFVTDDKRDDLSWDLLPDGCEVNGTIISVLDTAVFFEADDFKGGIYCELWKVRKFSTVPKVGQRMRLRLKHAFHKGQPQFKVDYILSLI